MVFRITILLDDISEEAANFMKEEWRSSNLEIFGREIDEREWKQTMTVLVYQDNENNINLVGVARCKIVGNTLRISELLVKTEYRKSFGIGSLILDNLESMCIRMRLHKIRLSTSELHQNIDFYQKRGFKIEATLKNDAFGLSWFILSKFIKY